jgi:2-methylcitrate dehydratase
MNTRLAVFACYLADHGLTGPSAPFDGRHGLVELLPFAEGELPLAGFDSWMIHRTWQKCFSVAYNIQPSVWAALELRDLVGPDDVAEITLNVPPLAYAVSGSEADKWDPRTKETADHSLPYAFAHAFRTGALGLDAFEPAAYRNADTLALMKHIKVVADPGFGADVPTVVGVNVEAVDTSGNPHRVSVPHPRGHDANPMTRDEITQKALGLITPVLGDRSEAAVELAWNAVQVDRFGDILDAYENTGSTGDLQ